MSEQITCIEPMEIGGEWSRKAGYKVTTTEQEITLLIDDEAD